MTTAHLITSRDVPMSATRHATATPAPSRHRGVRKDSLEYRLLYALGFLVFLVAAIIGRIVNTLTWRTASGERRSILREAKEATGATIPYAFMG